jgi:lipoprotein NlpI
VYRQKGELVRALADYDRAIELNPRYARGYLIRAIAKFEAGSFALSLSDLQESSALDPKDPYTVLWLDIVEKHSKLPSRLTEMTAPLDMTKWPAPVVRLFLGQMTPEALLAAAQDPDAKKNKGQICEANFYTGELALQSGSREEGERMIRLAGTDCPHSFFEWSAANSELEMLGANR